jgi:hypothetical protein
MRVVLQFFTASFLMCIFSSCGPQPSGEQYVRQKIPIEIQSGKTVSIEFNLSGNGPNDVGIRCKPEVWNVLTNGAKTIIVRLKSSDNKNTEVSAVNPGGNAAGFLYLIPDVHYLFEIAGEYHAKASVEITFPNAPSGVTPAEIIVCKTPADTGP